MTDWLLFWKYLFGIGLLIYLLTLVIIVPLGASGIVRWLKELRKPVRRPRRKP